MTDLSKNHVKWIKGFTKDQFDILVKTVIKSYWKIDNVVITDSAGDGGIDIKTYTNKNQKKIPIQVTVNKDLYSKLEDDLKKVRDTIDRFNYSDNFFFFYSGSPQEEKKEKIIKKAREEYSINLKFFDAKFIGALAENIDYPDIRTCIRELMGDFIEGELSYTPYEKMKFELLTHGGEITDIKNNIIRGYILHELFIDGSLKENKIIEKVTEYFGNTTNVDFVKRQIKWLSTKKKIIRNDEHSSDKEFCLQEEEKQRINNAYESIKSQEQLFISEIKNILKGNNVEDKYEEVIKETIEIYKGAYKRDLKEIKEDPNSNGFELNAIKDLKDYLVNIINNKDVSDDIVKKIIKICEVNDYLQRIAAGEVFSNITNIPQIENYIRRQPKPIYLDTPILLHLLCILIQDTSSYDNVYFNAVKDLYRYSSQNGTIKTNLKTTSQYVRETAFQLLSAYRLIPFSESEYFNKLGGSSNIFFNYFTYLKENDELEEGVESFEKFIAVFDLKIDINDSGILNYLSETIEGCFEANNIEIVDLTESHYTNQQIYEEIHNSFNQYHTEKGDYRPEITIKNDTLMLCELFTNKRFEIEPTILTWDSSFYDIRKKYHNRHPNANFWHLFRPAKYVDHLSLIKFNINSKAITKDIISIIEDDFNMQNKVKCLQDTLSRIVSLDNKSGIKLTKEIANIREESIFQLKQKDTFPSKQENHSPIDDVFINLSNYYQRKEGDYNINDLQEILKNEEVIDRIIRLLKEETDNYDIQKGMRESFYSDIDLIIKETKEKEKEDK